MKGARASMVERIIDDADRLYADMHKFGPALKKIERALSLAPNHAGSLVIKGRILFQLDRVREALKCFDLAISADRNCAEGYLERGRILYALKQKNKKALIQVRKALKLAGRDRWVKGEALRLLGHILSDLGRDREALSSYRAALRSNHEDEATHWSLGTTLFGLDQPAKALLHLDMALSLLLKEKKPDQVRLDLRFSDKAEALNALARHDEALQVIEAGLRKLKGANRKYLLALRERTQRLLR